MREGAPHPLPPPKKKKKKKKYLRIVECSRQDRYSPTRNVLTDAGKPCEEWNGRFRALALASCGVCTDREEVNQVQNRSFPLDVLLIEHEIPATKDAHLQDC